MSECLVLWGAVVAATSGVPGLFFSRTSRAGQWATTVLAVFGASLGLMGIGFFWVIGDSRPVRFDWPLPGAEFHVVLDGLAALFLAPIFLISLLGNLYGLGYWKQADHPTNGRKLRFFYGTLTGAMALMVIAQNSIQFLFGWEIMALSAYFLVTTEDHDAEVCQAGWLYLVATHVATLCLFGLFALLHAATGSYRLAPLGADALTPGMATAIFLLALVAFGLKAGMMPLHVWLPSAHAIAPSHVSAVMSGVIIKMGIYGLARITSLLPAPPAAWGGIVLLLGVVSGVLGVVFAIGQHDLKRLLAYHSIENIGIILIGLGLALLGRSLGRTDWVILGLAGGLLHVWNHALFKGLLFLCAGSVIHAAHTRSIDLLGGLANAMPWTAGSFLLGAVAICGLPPLNGFVSEFLIYLGLFGTLDSRAGPSFAAAALAAPLLALIGGLAVACFVKVFGAVFLGTARSAAAGHVPESPACMLGPQGVLVACCLLIGLAPVCVVPILGQAITAWAPDLADAGSRLTALAPLGCVSVMAMALWLALLLGGTALALCLRGSKVASGATWGCGYVAPTAQMQYTSSSFAQILVGLFGWALRPHTKEPRDLELFPPVTSFHSEVPDVVLNEAVLPVFQRGRWLLSAFRVLQQGSVQAYVFYVFLALLVLLSWRWVGG